MGKAVKSALQQLALYFFVLTLCQFAVDFGELRCSAAGDVLAHQAYKDLVAEIPAQNVDHLNAVFGVRGQDKMPHYHTALYHSAVVIRRFADLKDHLSDRCKSNVGVARRV